MRRYPIHSVFVLMMILAVALLVATVTVRDTSAQGGRRAPGTGEIEIITTVDPAAGIDPTATVPAGFSWRVLAVQAPLLTPAAAANRQAQLVVHDGMAANVLFMSDSPSNQAASLTRRYVAGAGLGRLDEGINAATKQWSFPDGVVVLAGYRVRIATTAIDAGDNWTAMLLLVERFRP